MGGKEERSQRREKRRQERKEMRKGNCSVLLYYPHLILSYSHILLLLLFSFFLFLSYLHLSYFYLYFPSSYLVLIISTRYSPFAPIFLTHLNNAPTSLSASPNHLSISVPAFMLIKVAPHSVI